MSSGVLLESSWGEEGLGAGGGVSVPPDEVSLHCRNCADWAAATDGRAVSVFRAQRGSGALCVTVEEFAKGWGRRKANSPASVPLERSWSELFAKVLSSKHRHRGR